MGSSVRHELRVKSSFTARGSGYYPDSSAMEGGYVDRLGKPLRTLQSFLKGSATYVSVAMDSSAFKYGTRLRIKELDAKYGRSIVFRVVDTGGAFIVRVRPVSLGSRAQGVLPRDAPSDAPFATVVSLNTLPRTRSACAALQRSDSRWCLACE